VAQAIRIGSRIREKGFTTYVAGEDECWSACALAWLAGVPRYMSPTASVGFHAAYDKSGDPHGLTNAVVGAYISRIGLPIEAVICATIAGPQEMMRLTPEMAEKCGISVRLVRPPPPAQASTLPPPIVPPATQMSPAPPIPVEPTPSLEERARRFVDAIFDVRKFKDQTALDWLHGRYNGSVKYSGKERTREEVIAAIERFFNRWPERAHNPIPDSIFVECKTSSNCVVSGLVDFWVRSGDRVMPDGHHLHTGCPSPATRTLLTVKMGQYFGALRSRKLRKRGFASLALKS
jgi:hypothetical protein